MAYASERRSPVVPSYVVNQLGVVPGPVNDVFVVSGICCSSPLGVFRSMHTIQSLLNSTVLYSINYSREAQLFIRCSDPQEAESLDAARVTFKFDDFYIRFYKLVTIRQLLAS